jgi:uncharacterized protein
VDDHSGTPVPMIMRKWGDLPHWEFASIPLGQDAHGTWFGTPAGTTFRRPDARFVSEHPHVVLVPRPGLLAPSCTADWVATFYADPAPVHIYVDITTPSTLTAGGVVTTDLDLDVVRPRDGAVWVDDEDEFAVHQVRFGYPTEVIRDATAVCGRVLRAVVDAEPPFDGVADRWLPQVPASGAGTA